MSEHTWEQLTYSSMPGKGLTVVCTSVPRNIHHQPNVGRKLALNNHLQSFHQYFRIEVCCVLGPYRRILLFVIDQEVSCNSADFQTLAGQLKNPLPKPTTNGGKSFKGNIQRQFLIQILPALPVTPTQYVPSGGCHVLCSRQIYVYTKISTGYACVGLTSFA